MSYHFRPRVLRCISKKVLYDMRAHAGSRAHILNTLNIWYLSAVYLWKSILRHAGLRAHIKNTSFLCVFHLDLLNYLFLTYGPRVKQLINIEHFMLSHYTLFVGLWARMTPNFCKYFLQVRVVEKILIIRCNRCGPVGPYEPTCLRILFSSHSIQNDHFSAFKL